MQGKPAPPTQLDLWPEIRSALHAIDGFAFALLNGVEGPLNGEQRAALAVVRRNARQLLRLTGAAVEWSDLTRGKVRLRRQLVDAVRLVESIAAEFAELAGRRGATFIAVAPFELPPVRGDQARLRRALAQVVAAALEGRADAVAWIAARPCDGGVEFAIGPFRDGDRVEEGRPAGEALGLAVARRVIELHGGTWRWTADHGGQLTFRLRGYGKA